MTRKSRFFGALSRRIYAAFLVAAVIPTALAGAIGVYLSLQTLRGETLRNLSQEVQVRSQGISRFFDQLSSELLYLANTREAADLAAALAEGSKPTLADRTARLERDYAALASLYPHIYQIRFLSADGNELVRVDRKGDKVVVVPRSQLQSKADRYYFQEAIGISPGQIYVSPLDLNIEFGKVEKPERPVIRVATPVAGGSGRNAGIVIVNLHADIILAQIQQMADARRGTAYLLDRSGHYLTRSAGSEAGSFSREPVEKLDKLFTHPVASMMVNGDVSPLQGNGWILAHTQINFAPNALADASRGKWKIALAFPERELFFSVFNLYLLYAVLFMALVVTAVGGYALSRRLLGPLEELAAETDAIASGDFGRRLTVIGNDEIAALGDKFNRMAERLNDSYRAINEHRDRLEEEVRARTRDLELERASLEAIIHNTADGILAVSNDGILRLANPAGMKLLHTADDPTGTTLASFWPQWPEIASDAASGTLRCDIEVPGHILALSVTPTNSGFIVVARDVSGERKIQNERRELDRQMFHMEKLTTLGELAMGIAHEIGNPLAGMKAVAQSMQYEEDIPPGLIEALKRLEAEVDRLSGFLRSFHGFAAPQVILSEPCDLAQTLDDVLFWTRKDAINRGISIELKGIDTLPALRADPHQLQQVFLNLLMNAVHAMPQGGTVAVEASATETSAKIHVCDTGIGIDSMVLNRIFEPFFTTRHEGTGLGLAIVRKIVEQHGGTIEASSTPGHGTCFSITWPLAGTRNA